MIVHFPIVSEKQTIVRPIAFKIVDDLRKYLRMGILENPLIVHLDEEGVRKISQKLRPSETLLPSFQTALV